MPLAADLWMIEHPAWLPTGNGARRVCALAGAVVLTEVQNGDLMLTALDGGETEPASDVVRLPDGAAEEVPELAKELEGLGQVGRLRNPSLWDALGTAILRQVIRAGQSKKYACGPTGANAVGLSSFGECMVGFVRPRRLEFGPSRQGQRESGSRARAPSDRTCACSATAWSTRSRSSAASARLSQVARVSGWSRPDFPHVDRLDEIGML